jgi:hypothetical protein
MTSAPPVFQLAMRTDARAEGGIIKIKMKKKT